MDNGATYGASCVNSTEGAILESFRDSDAGSLKSGSPVGLESKGSYLCALRGSGVYGTETVLRRMLHVPDLPVPVLFAEPDKHRLR